MDDVGEEIRQLLGMTRIAFDECVPAPPRSRCGTLSPLEVHDGRLDAEFHRPGYLRPANLTRHLRTLLGAGLIALVERRDTGRTVEKYYAATAARFVVEPDVSDLDEPHTIALGFAHSQLGAALARLPGEATGPTATLTLAVRLTPTTAETFAQELVTLTERFTAAE